MNSHTQWPAQKLAIGAAAPCSCAKLPLRPRHAPMIKRSALRRQPAPPTYSGVRSCQETATLQRSTPAAEPAAPLSERLQSPTEEVRSRRHRNADLLSTLASGEARYTLCSVGQLPTEKRTIWADYITLAKWISSLPLSCLLQALGASASR